MSMTCLRAQGDITGLIDGAKKEVVSYTYDTWGKLISTTGSFAGTLGVKNPCRYGDTGTIRKLDFNIYSQGTTILTGVGLSTRMDLLENQEIYKVIICSHIVKIIQSILMTPQDLNQQKV